jgi:hypothetical protein
MPEAGAPSTWSSADGQARATVFLQGAPYAIDAQVKRGRGYRVTVVRRGSCTLEDVHAHVGEADPANIIRPKSRPSIYVQPLVELGLRLEMYKFVFIGPWRQPTDCEGAGVEM